MRYCDEFNWKGRFPKGITWRDCLRIFLKVISWGDFLKGLHREISWGDFLRVLWSEIEKKTGTGTRGWRWLRGHVHPRTLGRPLKKVLIFQVSESRIYELTLWDFDFHYGFSILKGLFLLYDSNLWLFCLYLPANFIIRLRLTTKRVTAPCISIADSP